MPNKRVPCSHLSHERDEGLALKLLRLETVIRSRHDAEIATSTSATFYFALAHGLAFES